MYSKEKSPRNKTAIASGSGQSQPKPTGKKAEDLTPEEWEDIDFGWKVRSLIFDLEGMLRCTRRERQQLLRFLDACREVLDKANFKVYLEAEASKDYKNYQGRERAMRFAAFEKMGEIIEQQIHD
jgi:hypothetical protein